MQQAAENQEAVPPHSLHDLSFPQALLVPQQAQQQAPEVIQAPVSQDCPVKQCIMRTASSTQVLASHAPKCCRLLKTNVLCIVAPVTSRTSPPACMQLAPWGGIDDLHCRLPQEIWCAPVAANPVCLLMSDRCRDSIQRLHWGAVKCHTVDNRNHIP